ncbi:HPr family phosphocarrier protein [Coxiella endosymbiont of Amblyomma nuttalli]|uniref:HPr family phosphocarrier protein n=1 Tax=Coxiella endosymbiont of Amblyomma nuttalli TaxID=2749996 RepID=UPI001BA81B25|nr:HPr family phosphocarrier protein [Coxiella endosymbiont of Amblyomma nuttalli]
MIHKKLKIVNKLGLHARAAIKLTNLASRYQSKIFIHFNKRDINARSILGLMVLAANKGSEIELTTIGEDEKEAATAIEELINNKFGEAE